MRPGPCRVTASILLTVALAGCTAQDASSADAGAPPSVSAPSDPGQAALNVLVTDDSLAPIAQVQVYVVEADAESMTDEGGRTSFATLAPGTYKVAVQKLGYESAAKTAELGAGATVEVVFRLQAIAVEVERHETLIFRGHITCGFGLIQVRLITVCGTTGTGTAAGNVTVDPNHKDEFRHLGQPKMKSIVGELVWTSNAAVTAKEFSLALYQGWKCTPFCSSDNAYGSATGKSPVAHRADAFAGLKKGPAIISYVVGLPGQSADPPFILVVIQQSYNIYATHFFGAAAPEGFTANPDK